MLRALYIAKSGSATEKVDAMSTAELRKEVGFIPSTVVDELAENELFQVCTTYPATRDNPCIEDGSTAQVIMPLLKWHCESGDHCKATTTTFFKNFIVAPGGDLYKPNPGCVKDAKLKLDIRVCWYAEGRSMRLIIQGGKAELYDGNEVVTPSPTST